MHLLEVLNPVAQQRGMIATLPTNPRPGDLSGKTVGLVWSGTHGGDVALNRVGEMLQRALRRPGHQDSTPAATTPTRRIS